MSNPVKSWSKSLLFITLPLSFYLLFNIIAGGAYVLAVMGGNHMDDRTLYCSTPAEARRAGTFLDTVVVEPRLVRYGQYEVRFETCWVEQLRESHRPCWYARRIVTKQPRVAFYLRYHVTYQGKDSHQPRAWESPVISCEQGRGGHSLGQQEQDELTVFAGLMPDGGLLLDLPLALSVQGGPTRDPPFCFEAYPARFRQEP